MFFMNVILFIFVGAGGTRQIEKRSAPLPQSSQWHEDVLWYGAAASLCSSWHFRWRRPDWKVRAVGWVGGWVSGWLLHQFNLSFCHSSSLLFPVFGSSLRCASANPSSCMMKWRNFGLLSKYYYYYYKFSWKFLTLCPRLWWRYQ